MPTPTLWRRAAANTPEPDNEQACWIVQGIADRCGYMRLSIRTERGPRLVSVHRQILSELLGRPLRPEETGEHRCKVPGCWNLDHLEVLPLRDNLARRYAPTAGPWALPDAEHDELQRAADRAWSHRGRRVKRCPF